MDKSIKPIVVKLSFWKYLLYMLQATIEPILLASGLAILFSRFSIICAEVYAYTGTQNIWYILWAFNDDMQSDPVIYCILLGILLIWILYRAWVLKQRLLQDEYHKRMLEIASTQTEIFNRLADDMAEVKKSLEDIKDKLPK
jgi:hypothetical protein